MEGAAHVSPIYLIALLMRLAKTSSTHWLCARTHGISGEISTLMPFSSRTAIKRMTALSTVGPISVGFTVSLTLRSFANHSSWSIISFIFMPLSRIPLTKSNAWGGNLSEKRDANISLRSMILLSGDFKSWAMVWL